MRDQRWTVIDLGKRHFFETNHRYGIASDFVTTGLVAQVEGMGGDALARANLIAAAPDLLVCLQQMVSMISSGDQHGIESAWFCDAAAAIAKAVKPDT